MILRRLSFTRGVFFDRCFWFGLFFFGLTIFFHSPPDAREGQRYLNPPPEHIEHFHFGFRESLADSFWIRWIQDCDTCQVYGHELEKQDVPGPGQIGLLNNPRYKICDSSWGYKILDAVTKLAPKFRMPYLFGASALAVLTEDYKGATAIYERGLVEHPTDWEIQFRAAFHFQFDERDYKRAADLLNLAAVNGAPNWVVSLASRLYTEAGQLELGLAALESYRRMVEGNKEAEKIVDQRLNDLKKKVGSLSK